MSMEYAFDIYKLSTEFITDYPETKYPELMHKLGRPYSWLIIDSHDGYFICIPFRSAIEHKNGYLFTSTNRSKRTKSGLDYSKIVIIADSAYLDDSQAVVDQDEYNEAVQNMSSIAADALEYVDTYINHVNGTKRIHEREFSRRYRFSTLQYFHTELGIGRTEDVRVANNVETSGNQ